MAGEEERKNKTPKPEIKVRITENGPYIVTGSIPLVDLCYVIDEQGLSSDWEEVKKYPVEETYDLCRCGCSNNKPFCDGSHKRVRFQGTETASRDPYLSMADRTEGPEIDLTDAPKICASARFCDRQGGVWDRTRQSDDPESKRIAIEEVLNCPAGRLVVWNKLGQPIEKDLEPSIGVVQDNLLGVIGPLWLRGGIQVEAADGTVYEVRQRVTLCRCGRSKIKPFCDGSHTEP